MNSIQFKENSQQFRIEKLISKLHVEKTENSQLDYEEIVHTLTQCDFFIFLKMEFGVLHLI